MRIEPRPQRLVSTAEFGLVMRYAAERTLSDERLENNRRALEAAIGSLALTGGVAATVGMGLKATSAKLGLVIAVGVTASTAWWGIQRRHTRAPSADRPAAMQTAPAPSVVSPSTLAEPPKAEAAPTVPSARPGTVMERVAPRRPRLPRLHESGLAERAAKEMPPSAIAAQLDMFHAAQASAEAGRYEAALATLTQLERRYPDSPLAAEIILSRAEFLFLAARDAEAASFIESELDNPAIAARRAELWLTLGDVRLRQGSCPGAVEAYQHALGVGLRAADADAARSGLRRCTR